jgi:hypothetical protein
MACGNCVTRGLVQSPPLLTDVDDPGRSQVPRLFWGDLIRRAAVLHRLDLGGTLARIPWLLPPEPAAGARLPRAAIRRRLFFRYTLRWDKSR